MNRRILTALFIAASVAALSACAAPITTSTGAAKDELPAQAGAVKAKLDAAEQAAGRGDYAAAKSLEGEAYTLYESGLDKYVDSHDPALAESIDGQFGAGDGKLASLIAGGAPPDQIAAAADRLKDSLDEAAGYSSGVTGVMAGVNSAIIILREGLEAVLILGIILGYMRTTRRDPKYARLVFAGVGAAVALSLATWWASQTILSAASLNRELLEGVTSILAVGVLFYCTNWLFHKAYVVDWMTFVKSEAGKALAAGSALGLVGLGFTVVYREGFETVLFYQAMMFNADPAPILAGLAIGLVLLSLIAYGVLKLSVSLPVRPFFSVTGALMLLLSVKFAGLGAHALHEAGLIGATGIPGMGDVAILRELLGIYPTVETLAAQLILLAAVAVTFGISSWQWKRSAAASTLPI